MQKAGYRTLKATVSVTAVHVACMHGGGFHKTYICLPMKVVAVGNPMPYFREENEVNEKQILNNCYEGPVSQFDDSVYHSIFRTNYTGDLWYLE